MLSYTNSINGRLLFYLISGLLKDYIFFYKQKKVFKPRDKVLSRYLVL